MSRKPAAAHALTTDVIQTAVRGPKCRLCREVHTRNPSKTCTKCLGPLACPRCHGSGVTAPIRRCDAPAACTACPGTGMRGSALPLTKRPLELASETTPKVKEAAPKQPPKAIWASYCTRCGEAIFADDVMKGASRETSCPTCPMDASGGPVVKSARYSLVRTA